MKNRITLILAILSMSCAVWLVGENRALKQVNEQLIIEKAELVDQFFDLQHEYEKVWMENFRLTEK